MTDLSIHAIQSVTQAARDLEQAVSETTDLDELLRLQKAANEAWQRWDGACLAIGWRLELIQTFGADEVKGRR